MPCSLVWSEKIALIQGRRVCAAGRCMIGFVSLASAAVAMAAPDTPNPAPTASPAPAQVTRFEVAEIRVLGNTVLESIEVERAVYPFVGPGRTIDDMNGARSALENVYHARGYGTVFVDLPEQKIEAGIVRLKVTEGRLESVHVTGTRYFSNRQILAAMPEAARGSVPNLPKMQQEIAAVNGESVDRSVIPILKAGSQPGTVDLALNVKDHSPLHASVELNNQQTQDTKALRALASVSYNNLFGRLDQISLQYQTSPQRTAEVGVFAANLAIHLYDHGPPLSFYYIDSKTDVATLGTLGVLGKGNIYGLRLSNTLANSAEFSSALTYGIDYKHFGQSISVDPQTQLNTPNSYMEFSLDSANVWRSELRTWALDISANFGSREVVGDSDHFALARYQGRPNFFYLHGSGSMTTALPGGMQFTTKLAGQGAVEPLVSNEYFSIAGSDGVRGYLEAEEFGDVAVKGTLQLESPLLHAWAGSLAGKAFAFFDDGHVKFLASLPDQPDHADLRSAGIGIEVLSGNNYSGLLTWAYPLLTGPRTHSGDSQVLFVVRGSL